MKVVDSVSIHGGVDNRPGSKTRIGKSNTGEKMFLLGDGGDV